MTRRLWFEEELDPDLRWVFSVKSILHTGRSEFQDIELVDSGPFGKVLVLDGKLQSAEADEFAYHETLVHPALLTHPNPGRVFIMGGGEGSTARECLRHASVESVLMCDIDQEVVSFCSQHLTENADAFANPKLEVRINDARAELAEAPSSSEGYDVIIGDLADPVEGGPCFQLYTKAFYETVVKRRLKPGGILVTQAGPAGILSAQEVFSPIHNTLRQVFKHVRASSVHIPSYGDTWGFVMASDEPLPPLTPHEGDEKIAERITGELKYIDGETLGATFALNKRVRKILEEETSVYTEESPLFIHGQGTGQLHSKNGQPNGHSS